MPPKKKSQKQNNKKPQTNTSKTQTSSSASAPAPRLTISAENENRLRRLLLNSARPVQPAAANESLSDAQKRKKLNAVYEKLSCEGFTDDQIELALSSLKENATFEAALDWLCLNLPGNELPLKFSSGTSLHTSGGSVSVISIARQDQRLLEEDRVDERLEEDVHQLSVRTKGRCDNDEILDSRQPSQADWIRQYLIQQQEEEESGTWEDAGEDENFPKKNLELRSYDVIAKEYYDARIEAAKAKEKGDKKSQEQASHSIRKLKQELSILGISDDVLMPDFEQERASTIVSDTCTSESSKHFEPIELTDAKGKPAIVGDVDHTPFGGANLGCSNFMESSVKPISDDAIVQEKFALEVQSEDVELGDFFVEGAELEEALPTEILEFKEKEKMRELSSEKNLQKLVGIWKKGDPKRIPKAVLHQLCQKFGWGDPKFNKKAERGQSFSYVVNVLCKASGRGKNRKVGGLVSLQLPEEDEKFECAEDGQNGVAAFALYKLFPDLPTHLGITEPYASLVLRWKGGESSSMFEDIIGDRRAGFIERLLHATGLSSNALVDEKNISGTSENTHVEESRFSRTSDVAGINFLKDDESSHLRLEMQNKKKMGKYKEMLKSRATLPIAGLKNLILDTLRDNAVIVVCGETGSGKTTQVPQFILDDMIESGNGGHCSIICTQPRRIAAVSVAERVADERCEPSPGSGGSLVGYQVRLDSARNEKTKLLFCTTGILLRKLAGDRNLTGVTHVIVDEVHERSLLGDFLLIILKDLIKKQSVHGEQKLKVILMSATVDSELFSRYFGNCPVIAAEGRTHPVTAYYLEDIYESMNYQLASDSPAASSHKASVLHKSGPVNNKWGKKNLIISGWGDDSLLSEDCLNPYYVSNSYLSYSEQTQQNLKRLNEDVIDYDLLEDLVCHVDETCGEGAILVFLPGVSEIYNLFDKLVASYRFHGPSADWILPLHSSIAPTDQKRVFLQPPKNIRKVIISTNIAETSITIDDVVYVIDCGKHKENRYNPQKKLSSMVEDWISQANARQRRGRAGRVKPGICFCLYTRHRFETLMRPYQVPEMLRMPLIELCLQIKLLSLGHIKPILSKALEPPKEEAMTTAISLLYEVGALEGNEQLTSLGHHLAKLPVDVLIGKMLLYGAIFGCLSPVLSIAASLSYKSPFLHLRDEKQSIERAKLMLLAGKPDASDDSSEADSQSDHLVMAVAYRKWAEILQKKGVKAAEEFCNSNFLSKSVMHTIRDMRIQFGTLLADIGFIHLPKDFQIVRKKSESHDHWLSERTQAFNMYSDHQAVVKAIVSAGLYPNVAATEQGIAASALNGLKQSWISAAKAQPIWFDGRREVHIHPSSINSNSKAFSHPFLVYLEKVETNKIFLRDTTIVSPFSILLFGGSIIVQHQTGQVIVDGWLKLTAAAQVAVLFKELRSALHALLKELIRNPENATIVNHEVVRSTIQLLLDESPQNKI